MKKENYSDYVKMAYVFYAKSGYPNMSKVREISRNAQNAKQKAEASDLEAVARTLEYIQMLPDANIIEECLRKVYFHERVPKRGVITAYVREAAEQLHISEAVVYRLLHNCRTLTATFRGLRVEDSTIKNFL